MVGTQTAILPLIPYLDTIRWILIAVALGGIAINIYARLQDWRLGAAVISAAVGKLAGSA